MAADRQSKRDRVVAKSDKTGTAWKVPRGGSINDVTRAASKQVISHYGEALKKLQKH